MRVAVEPTVERLAGVDFGALASTLPAGWYPIPRPDPGAVLRCTIGDVPVAVWGSEQTAELAAFLARCPHLGADLAGGSVSNGRLHCAFHQHSFGPDGRGCLPTEDGVARSAQPFDVREVDGHLAAFIAPYGWTGEPWEPRSLGPEHGTEYAIGPIRTCAPYDAPPLIVAEGAFDIAHFMPVHGGEPRNFAANIEGTFAEVSFDLPGVRGNDYLFELSFDGLNRLRERIRKGKYEILRLFWLARVDGEWLAYVDTWANGPSVRGTMKFLEGLSEVAMNDLQHDRRIWANRRFDLAPSFGPDDRVLVAYRRWATGFLPNDRLHRERRVFLGQVNGSRSLAAPGA